MFTAQDFLVSKHGGNILYYQDNELMFEIGVPAGRHSAAQYIVAGYDVEVEDLAVISPLSAVRIITAENREDTGADPEYVISGAERERRKIAAMVESASLAAVERFAAQHQQGALAPSAPDSVLEAVTPSADDAQS